jgi:hypothetical protein
MPLGSVSALDETGILPPHSRESGAVFGLQGAISAGSYGVFIFTHMSHASPKRQALEATGTFNRRFAVVRHELFQAQEFFDPQDLLQLKYEALRAVEKEGYSIARAAGEFGLSRPTIYQAQTQLKTKGLDGVPRHANP